MGSLQTNETRVSSPPKRKPSYRKPFGLTREQTIFENHLPVPERAQVNRRLRRDRARTFRNPESGAGVTLQFYSQKGIALKEIKGKKKELRPGIGGFANRRGANHNATVRENYDEPKQELRNSLYGFQDPLGVFSLSLRTFRRS